MNKTRIIKILIDRERKKDKTIEMLKKDLFNVEQFEGLSASLKFKPMEQNVILRQFFHEKY